MHTGEETRRQMPAQDHPGKARIPEPGPLCIQGRRQEGRCRPRTTQARPAYQNQDRDAYRGGDKKADAGPGPPRQGPHTRTRTVMHTGDETRRQMPEQELPRTLTSVVDLDVAAEQHPGNKQPTMWTSGLLWTMKKLLTKFLKL